LELNWPDRYAEDSPLSSVGIKNALGFCFLSFYNTLWGDAETQR
jgi:hypothetical protein